MGLIRSTFSLVFLGLFLLIGLTVPVGERTLFGHVANIWESDEAQELVDGVKDSSEPLVDRVKRGVEAGLTDEVREEITGEKVDDENVADQEVADPKGADQKPVGEEAADQKGADPKLVGEEVASEDAKKPLATTKSRPNDGDSAQ